jgi:hypothetical protein
MGDAQAPSIAAADYVIGSLDLLFHQVRARAIERGAKMVKISKAKPE